MTADFSKHFANIFHQLERFGLLLVSDQNFPSVAYTIARSSAKDPGGPILKRTQYSL